MSNAYLRSPCKENVRKPFAERFWSYFENHQFASGQTLPQIGSSDLQIPIRPRRCPKLCQALIRSMCLTERRIHRDRKSEGPIIDVLPPASDQALQTSG